MRNPSTTPGPSDAHIAGPRPPEVRQRRAPEFLAPGTQFTFDVHMDALRENSSGRATALQVSAVERISDESRKGWRLAWTTRGMPGFVLRSERVQELVETAEGETDYACWETFYGLLAPVVNFVVGSQLTTGFGVWMADLKAEAEKAKAAA